jgi:hypothetical protein
VLVVTVQAVAPMQCFGPCEQPMVVIVENNGGVPTDGPVVAAFATSPDPDAGNNTGVINDQEDCENLILAPDDDCYMNTFSRAEAIAVGESITGKVIVTAGTATQSAVFSYTR